MTEQGKELFNRVSKRVEYINNYLIHFGCQVPAGLPSSYGNLFSDWYVGWLHEEDYSVFYYTHRMTNDRFTVVFDDEQKTKDAESWSVEQLSPYIEKLVTKVVYLPELSVDSIKWGLNNPF